MSVGNATDKAEWRRTYGQIPLFGRRLHSDLTSALPRQSLAEDNCISDENSG